MNATANEMVQIYVDAVMFTRDVFIWTVLLKKMYKSMVFTIFTSAPL